MTVSTPVNKYDYSKAIFKANILQNESQTNHKEKKILCSPPFFLIIAIFLQIMGYALQLDEILKVDPIKYKEVWRYFTYAFVHADIKHLLSNILVQLLTGWRLEKTFGWWKTGIFFVISSISGSLTTFITKRGLMGSSAVTYSFIFAGLLYFSPKFSENRKTFVIYFLSFFGIIIQNIYNYMVEDLGAWIAHLAGAVIGVFFGAIAFLIDINNN